MTNDRRDVLMLSAKLSTSGRMELEEGERRELPWKEAIVRLKDDQGKFV